MNVLLQSIETYNCALAILSSKKTRDGASHVRREIKRQKHLGIDMAKTVKDPSPVKPKDPSSEPTQGCTYMSKRTK